MKNNLLKNTFISVLILISFLSLNFCGQTGPLYLPKEVSESEDERTKHQEQIQTKDQKNIDKKSKVNKK